MRETSSFHNLSLKGWARHIRPAVVHVVSIANVANTAAPHPDCRDRDSSVRTHRPEVDRAPTE